MTDLFQPPIIEARSVGDHQNQEGALARISLLVTDANHRMFAMTVATQRDLAEQVADAMQYGEPTADEVEPVFSIPTDLLTADDIAAALNLDPSLLSRYLVPVA